MWSFGARDFLVDRDARGGSLRRREAADIVVGATPRRLIICGPVRIWFSQFFSFFLLVDFRIWCGGVLSLLPFLPRISVFFATFLGEGRVSSRSESESRFGKRSLGKA